RKPLLQGLVMNSRNTALYSLVSLLLSTGCFVGGERKTVRVEHSWPAATIHHLEVDEIDGTINVAAGAADQIHMLATVHARGREPNRKRENFGYFRTELDGDTLVIRRDREHFRFHFFDRNDVRIDYDLQVPVSVAMDL